ncbi:MAG: D-alanyl-D-alanine carboxypeptidase family protein, partial [Oscillospiraceae bacterium]|nr:D-alanyl-D-alanine carboxypeptidase family protein [Oscillospiraceae bacterium]
MKTRKVWCAAVLGVLVLLSACQKEAEDIGSQRKVLTLGISVTDSNIDNSWAMFLVNEQNPITKEYSEGIERSVVYESWRTYSMDSRAAEYMIQMIDDARNDGIELIVMSAYRSFESQENSFEGFVKDNME